jgi:hypothetical protein
MVELIQGPWTLEAKEAAIQSEVRAIYDAYFAKAVLNRTYFPDRLPQIPEMKNYGHLVSPESKEILLGFLGVESFVDDYVYGGIQVAGDSVATRALYLQWGLEEARHGKTFRRCLIASGLYSEDYLDRYLATCSEERWTFEKQTGHPGDKVRAVAYAALQELNTRLDYTDMRLRLWRGYGSPTNKDARPVFPAIAGAIRYVEIDEGAHQANFMNILGVYLRYRPDVALEAMLDMCSGYRMPIVDLPNGEEFMRVLLDTNLESARRTVQQVITPSLNRMGLEDRAALRRAVRNFRNLRAGSLVQVPGKPLPSWHADGDSPIYEMTPRGEFVLVGSTSDRELSS